MTLYHVSPRRNRVSIFRRGLLARDTTAHRFMCATENADTLAVFGHECAERAREWSYMYSEPCDVWAFDASDLPREHDPYRGDYMLETAWRVLTNVPRERLTFVGAAW